MIEEGVGKVRGWMRRGNSQGMGINEEGNTQGEGMNEDGKRQCEGMNEEVGIDKVED